MDWLLAHGIVGRTDLPVPEWLFVYGGAIVLIVSFVALAVLWPQPKLERTEEEGWHGVMILPAPWLIEGICGAIGVFLLGVTVWAGLAGDQAPTANWAPTFVYVIFWLGFAAASVLLGDVFKAFNPWRAIGRAVAGVAKLVRRGELPEPLPYPERLGHWPAALGIFAFAFLELAASDGDKPRNVAIAALVYSAVTFVGMALYGVERWIRRGEAFSVYFNLYSRISIWERRGAELGVRKPLAGLASLTPLAGTVPLLAVMIGSVSFDGIGEKKLWTDPAQDIAKFLQDDLSMSPENSLVVTYGAGLLVSVLLVYGFYRLGCWGASRLAGGRDASTLALDFVHSLVPIAFVYAAAHYMTLLLFQGQAIWFLASNPLGEDWDIFGTADRAIDYTVIGANATWYWQFGFVIAGHIAALILAHDRAVAIYSDAKAAVRSQYWMLGVMIAFTSLALWLLSQLGT